MAEAKEGPISFVELPDKAQQFITEHFQESHVATMTKESGSFGVEYEVRFTNGNKVEFDKKGDWVEIECRKGTMPRSVIPNPIWDFVAEKHHGAQITQIEHGTGGYDVELDDGTEICFNVFGEFFKYGD